MSTKKVWLVTGASKGLGLALVKKLVNDGYRVAATSRDPKSLETEIGSNNDQFMALEMDLVSDREVARAIAKIVARFGTIDVVVNNAGYGQLGTIEELSDEESRANFDVNVFGVLNVIRNVMPHFRKNGSGAFFNVSSIAGYLGTFPGWGIYNATKFAVAGLTEALFAETKSLGITATIVYPGYFKTNFLLQGSLRKAANPIDAYREARELEVIHDQQIIGNQPGDPDRAAAAIIKAASDNERPLHLFLGSDAFAMAQTKIDAVKREMEKYERLSKSTDFVHLAAAN